MSTDAYAFYRIGPPKYMDRIKASDMTFRPNVAERALADAQRNHPRVTLPPAYDSSIWQDATDATRVDTGKPFPFFGLNHGEPIQPWMEPTPMMGAWLDDGRRFLAWNNGHYAFSRADGKPIWVRVMGVRTITLDRGWSLSFPSGWDAPASLKLDTLKPWSELSDKATSHFSGSATYRTTVLLDGLKPDEQMWLDLDHVADIADVRINGHKVAVLWAAPFRVDISSQAKAGSNEIEIEVTNTWHNRLVYDAGLPDAQQKTWTTGKTSADDPLEPAGLVGPVQLHVGKVVKLLK